MLVTTTENFLYEFSDAFLFSPGPIGDAFARALALAATCEADFLKLENLFAVGGGFGPSNRVNIMIDTNIGSSAVGVNYGYQKGDGKTLIRILPFAGDPNGDAIVRAVFVAEMSEIMMDYRIKVTGIKVWNRGDSMGEALSTVCEAELHPEGYFAPSTAGGPRIGLWLNSPQFTPYQPPYAQWRPNWIDQTENTDKNFHSFGCGILFINFLRFQLGKTLNEIILKGGDTFAETYQNLTGETDGWNSFSKLINTNFPIGRNYSPATDNVFPLPQLAGLTISPDTVMAGDIATGTVTLNSKNVGAPMNVDLGCGAPAYARFTTPPVAVINQSASSADFPIYTTFITTPFKPALVPIFATVAGDSVAAILTVRPQVDVGILESLTLNPGTVTGGETSEGTVTLEAVVATDTIVALAAVETGGLFPKPGDESSVASVSSSVTVHAGDLSATFAIKTSEIPPHVTRSATILARAIVAKYAHLTVEGG